MNGAFDLKSKNFFYLALDPRDFSESIFIYLFIFGGTGL
jgi:hypothetical protein